MTQSEEQNGRSAGKIAENLDQDKSVQNAQHNTSISSENAENENIVGPAGNGPESTTQLLLRVSSIISSGDDKSELSSMPRSSAEMFSHSDLQSTTAQVANPVPDSQMAANSEHGQKESAQATPGSGVKGRSRKSVAAHRRKRRRTIDDSDEEVKVDDTTSSDGPEANTNDMEMNMDMTPIPTQTKSGRMVNRPVHFVPDADPPRPTGRSKTSPSHTSYGQATIKKWHKNGKPPSVVVCTRCQRSYGPPMNMLLFCGECNNAWHQFCHDPVVMRAVVASRKQTPWFCSSCRPTEGCEQIPVKITLTHKAARGLNDPPVGHPVGGENFSAAERRSYLSTLSHAALVDLLMNISDGNPSLPVFPENLRTVIQRDGSKAFTSDASPVPKKRRYNNAMDDSEYGLINEHRLYPQPGCGFRLPPEVEEDLSLLLEDPSCPTFSYKRYRHTAGGEPEVAAG